MSRFGTPSSTRRQGRRAGGRAAQRGQTLIATIALTSALAILVTVGFVLAQGSTGASAREDRGGVALQVADAGINHYVSRLVEDPYYYQHFVDQAEDPRVDSSGVVHQPGTAWTPGQTWTYSGPSTTWVDLQNARFGKASYSLRITPPPSGSDIVTITSTGRVGTPGRNPRVQAIQSQVHPTSIADFQMISNASIKYGTTATTTGKIYSSVDVNHEGVAKAPVYAKHYVCSNSGGSCSSSQVDTTTYQGGAYDSKTTPSFADKFPTPIDFGHFTDALSNIKDAAVSSGTYFNATGVKGWLVQFTSGGQLKVWKVTNTSDLGQDDGDLACPTTVNIPSSGAVYFEQPVIVSDGATTKDACNGTGPRDSVVNGRVTVATSGNVYIGGNISYNQVGDDVLGLIASGEVIITKYTPSTLNWRAATLAQNGQWRTYTSNYDGHQSMTYTGSQTTSDGGYASMFANRTYNYDDSLQYLRPPLYPVLEGSWTTQYWREVTPP